MTMKRSIGMWIVLVAGIASAADFSSWQRKMQVTFSGYNPPGGATPLTNFPALVVLSTDISGFNYTQFASGSNADLRFADASETNELNYEIESWNTNGSSYVWVQVPTLASTQTAIWAYWNKSGTNAPGCATNGMTWDTGFRGVWHMQQTNTVDATTNTTPGTAKNGLTTTNAGVAGNALLLDGVNDYLDLGNGLSMGAGDASLSIWFKTTNTSVQAGFIGKSSARAYLGRYMIYVDAGGISALFDGGGGGKTASTPWSSAYYDNRWHQLTATYNRSGLEALYVDGIRKATYDISGYVSSNMTSADPFYVGAYGNNAGGGPNSGFYYPGALDEGRLMRVAVSSNWVWATYMNTISNGAFTGSFNTYAPVQDCLLPGIADATVSNVTTGGATFMANLYRLGGSTPSVQLFWGGADGGTNRSAWGHTNDLGVTAATGPVSTNLTGLASDTMLYFRFCATNSAGEWWVDATSSVLAGTVRVEASPATASYGSPGAFTISRPVTATNGSLAISYTVGGSASNGLDYTALTGTLTLNAGLSNAVLSVNPAMDMDLTNEDAVLTLTSGSYATGAMNQATVTITPWSGLASITGNWYVASNGNDNWAGTNWATAFATISNGVAHAIGGQTVLVGVGSYGVTTQLNVSTNLTLLGVGGASNTIVTRGVATITNRILSITHAGAVVNGFTITNGYENTDAYGGGVYMTGGRLVNCIVTGNTDTKPSDGRPFGGGLYASAGTISNCLIRGNRSTGSYAKGGGVSCGASATMVQCVVESNSATETGGGIAFMGASRVLNCLVRGNSAANMGAVYLNGAALMANCTVVYNSGGDAIGVENAATFRVTNTISYFNSPRDISAAAAPYFAFSCSTGLTHGAAGNITNNPLFVSASDYHLTTASPCVDAGFSGLWTPADRDLEGNARLLHGVVDMGAYETPYGFGCNFVSDKTTGFPPLTNVLTAYVSATNQLGLYYAWDVNADGVIEQQGTDKAVITNVYTLPGLYSVALWVSNAIGQVDAFTNRNYISVSTTTMYVSPNGSNILPYSSWSTAATSLHAAVAFASDGGLISITNGTYVLTNTVTLSLGVTLKSVNGPGATVIAGTGALPCFLLTNPGAVLDGLTLSNGYSSADGGALTVMTGTVQNCVIRNSSAGRYGGGVYLANGLLKNCVIAGNASLGNVAPLTSAGGGLYMTNGTVLHCTLADNTAVRGSATGGDGLAMTGGAVSNSIIYFNSAFPYVQFQRNVYKSGGTMAYCCTFPAVAGTNNVSADPQFVDRPAGDYRLLPGSPCIDRATNLAAVATDIEGTSRLLDGDTVTGAAADMGAYEDEALTSGTFRCNFIAATNEGVNALSNVVFTAYVAGAVTNVQSYYWDLTNDGAMDLAGAGQNPVSNSYGVGFYSVRLAVTNTSSQGASVTKSGYIRVGGPVICVATNGTATLPYDTWAKAATNLNAAVEAAYYAGFTQQVVVSNGQYALDRQLELRGPVTVTGVNGASNTVAYRTGTYAHRLVYMTNPVAVVDGLTLTNGYENTTDHGGGVRMTAGMLRNCIVVKNTDVKLDDYRPYGGGIYASGGVVSNCAILRNTSSGSYGKTGGIYGDGAVIQRCDIEGNYSQESSGGGVGLAGNSRVDNCLIRSNNTSTVVVYSGSPVVRNCTIVDNTGSGSGLYLAAGATGVNCIVYFNAVNVTLNGGVALSSCASGLTHGVSGNLTNDPLFVNRALGDLRLQPASPCVNAGDLAGWTRGDIDLGGSVRWQGTTVDMGAYEAPFAGGSVYVFR